MWALPPGLCPSAHHHHHHRSVARHRIRQLSSTSSSSSDSECKEGIATSWRGAFLSPTSVDEHPRHRPAYRSTTPSTTQAVDSSAASLDRALTLTTIGTGATVVDVSESRRQFSPMKGDKSSAALFGEFMLLPPKLKQERVGSCAAIPEHLPLGRNASRRVAARRRRTESARYFPERSPTIERRRRKRSIRKASVSEYYIY